MGEIVNLKRARKRRDRDQEAAQAAAARLLHGCSRTERQNAAREQERARAALDNARLSEEQSAERRPGAPSRPIGA